MSQKKTIGLQIDNLDGAYSDTIWPELYRRVKEKGYDFLLFPGRSLRSPVPLDYQFNRIYNFISTKTLDGLILTSGLDFFTSVEEQSRIISEFGSIPKISMGPVLSGIPSVITENRKSITAAMEHLYRVHNRKRVAFISGPTGSYEAMTRRQGYLDYFLEQNISSDPDLIIDGVDFHEFTGSSGVIELLERGISFDGLICSSDSQALGAYQELSKRGIRVPLDVSLFGFDDIRASDASLTGLSSVHQPFMEMCEKTVDLLDLLIQGEEIPSITMLPLSLTFRSSCGCFSENMEQMDHLIEQSDNNGNPAEFPRKRLLPFFRDNNRGERFIQLLDRRILALIQSEDFEKESSRTLGELNQLLNKQEVERLEVNNWHPLLTIILDWIYQLHLEDRRFREINIFFQKVRILLSDKQNMLENLRSQEYIRHTEVIRILSQRFIFTSDFSQIEFALSETLNALGVKSFHIFLFEGDYGQERTFYLPLPEYSRPVISQFHRKRKNVSKRRFRTERLISDSLQKGEDSHYIVLPLFQTDELIGYMLVEPEVPQGTFYLNLLYLLSSVIKSVVLFQSREDYQKILQKTLKQLEKTNKKLEEQNRIDHMTGLYNRRGFYLLAENQLQLVRRMRKTGLIFYGDLDGLKRINDNWGHKAGDEAIAGAAWVLENTFRSSDVLARFGGDEFVVMTIDADDSMLEEIFQRMKANLERKNHENRGYEIAISMGHLQIDESNSHLNLDELLHLADQRLYQEKQRRKRKQKQKKK